MRESFAQFEGISDPKLKHRIINENKVKSLIAVKVVLFLSKSLFKLNFEAEVDRQQQLKKLVSKDLRSQSLLENRKRKYVTTIYHLKVVNHYKISKES